MKDIDSRSQVTRILNLDIYNRTNTDMQLYSIDIHGGNLRGLPKQTLKPGEVTNIRVVQGMSAWPHLTVKYSTVSPSYLPNLEVNANFRGHNIKTSCKPGFKIDESHHSTGVMYTQNLYVGVSLLK